MMVRREMELLGGGSHREGIKVRREVYPVGGPGVVESGKACFWGVH